MARHKAHHHHHDYNVGRYAPKKNLGKIIVSVNNDEKVCKTANMSGVLIQQKQFPKYSIKNKRHFFFLRINFQEYEDGEVLIEHEPVRYELRDIKKDKIRTSKHPDPRVLGSTVLNNNADHTTAVDSVISYTYDKIIYWGTIEGVARGLPTEVYENPKLPPVSLGPTGWGFKINETKTEVRSHDFWDAKISFCFDFFRSFCFCFFVF